MALQVAVGTVLIPAAHLLELVAADLGEDATASFDTEVVEDVPHTLGIVDAGGAVEVLELAASLASTVATSTSGIPVAE